MTATKDLAGKTAVVTGSSRGIGRGIALHLASRGAAVAVSSRSSSQLAAQVVEEIETAGGRALARTGDLGREAEVIGLFDDTVATFGPVDIVVANAAQLVIAPFTELTEADFDDHLVGDLKNAFFVLREAARRIRDGGRIVAISSMGSRIFVPHHGLYLGVKGALEQFVRVLSREVGIRGVTVNAVSPGVTDTDGLLDAHRDAGAALTPFDRLGEPDDIAEVVGFLAGPGGRWVTGQNIAANGGAA